MRRFSEETTFDDLVRTILWLDRSLEVLHPAAARLGIPSPVDTEWFSLLRKKLVPQLSRRSHLVVAVTGGTNTGKSALFNLLAGENASAADPDAAGTKHPVCLLPAGTNPEELLPHYFGMFELRRWRNAADPLEQTAEHRLYWNLGENVPEHLLLIDTPDIDSDAEVNWERARNIRQVADLLIGVLTAQKYNDAAVKRYFREAAEAGKPVLLVWNMAYHEQYRDVWPEWVAQFRHETGVTPLAVFATPHDRVAAENRTLPVFDLGIETPGSRLQTPDSEPVVSLRDYLNRIRFDELKMQALTGAARRLDAKQSGIGEYLQRIQTASNDFASAAQTIRNREHLEIEWPAIPKVLLAEEVGRWCNSKRPELLQNVSVVYDTLLVPVQWAWGRLRNSRASKQQHAEQQEELAVVLQLVEQTIHQLKTIAETTPNTVLQKELSDYLGDGRKHLLEKSEAVHRQIPPKTDERIRTEVFAILNQWASEHPKQWRLLHQLDMATLGTHAVLSAGAILTCGVFGVGAAIGTAGAIPYLIATGGITGGSEALFKIVGEEVRLKIAELKVAIQQKYADWRKNIFLERFESELWGNMLAKFDLHAQFVNTEPYLETVRALEQLRRLMSDI
ncbi:MAG: 50S ribosome-binding GTPase [Planctomycetaceae bacterium]|nr:50S ribosome-binding GTPase [Planctomycetaceae bacterium]